MHSHLPHCIVVRDSRGSMRPRKWLLQPFSLYSPTSTTWIQHFHPKPLQTKAAFPTLTNGLTRKVPTQGPEATVYSQPSCSAKHTVAWVAPLSSRLGNMRSSYSPPSAHLIALVFSTENRPRHEPVSFPHAQAHHTRWVPKPLGLLLTTSTHLDPTTDTWQASWSSFLLSQDLQGQLLKCLTDLELSILPQTPFLRWLVWQWSPPCNGGLSHFKCRTAGKWGWPWGRQCIPGWFALLGERSASWDCILPQEVKSSWPCASETHLNKVSLPSRTSSKIKHLSFFYRRSHEVSAELCPNLNFPQGQKQALACPLTCPYWQYHQPAWHQLSPQALWRASRRQRSWGYWSRVAVAVDCYERRAWCPPGSPRVGCC